MRIVIACPSATGTAKRDRQLGDQAVRVLLAGGDELLPVLEPGFDRSVTRENLPARSSDICHHARNRSVLQAHRTGLLVGGRAGSDGGPATAEVMVGQS